MGKGGGKYLTVSGLYARRVGAGHSGYDIPSVVLSQSPFVCTYDSVSLFCDRCTVVLSMSVIDQLFYRELPAHRSTCSTVDHRLVCADRPSFIRIFVSYTVLRGSTHCMYVNHCLGGGGETHQYRLARMVWHR